MSICNLLFLRFGQLGAFGLQDVACLQEEVQAAGPLRSLGPHVRAILTPEELFVGFHYCGGGALGRGAGAAAPGHGAGGEGGGALALKGAVGGAEDGVGGHGTGGLVGGVLLRGTAGTDEGRAITAAEMWRKRRWA